MSGPQKIGQTIKFPTISLEGGPQGRSAILKINGQEAQRCHRVEIIADVNEVIRVKTFQYAEAHVEVRGELEEGFIVDIREFVDEDGNDAFTRPLVKGRGKTIIEALRDAADTLEATEKAQS